MIDQYRATPAGQVHTIEWHDAPPDAPWLHFAHATGMHARVYEAVLAPLAGRFHIVASDARGHGASRLPADPALLSHWSSYADDLAELLDAVHPGRWWLAGHSMGATISALLAARRRHATAGLVMIEPAFIPFAAPVDWRGGRNPMAEQAERRRAVWPSAAAIVDAYRGRGVFARWDEATLVAYVAGGTRPTADGTVELACTPAWEAATFRAVADDLEAALGAWGRPLTLLRGTVGSTVTDADATTIIASCPGSIDLRIEGAGHFVPLERPDLLGNLAMLLEAA